MRTASLRLYCKLLLLAFLAVLVHGYHLGADDAAIYIPAIKKAFHPRLYPFGAEFFMEHERLSIFSTLVAGSAHLFHLSIDVAIFLWQIFGIFLLLAATWRVACLCFQSSRSRWAAVCLLAALLTVPVAGTALVIADPYLTARTLSTPASIFAIDSFLRGRKLPTTFWIVLTALVHPQMAVFVIGFLIFLYWTDRTAGKRGALKMASNESVPVAAAAALPSRWPQGFNFHSVTGPYREVLYTRSFFFAGLWHWYEWLGAILPLALLYGFTRLTPRGTLPAFHRLCRAMIPFGLVSIAAFLLLSFNSDLVTFVRLQPMRTFDVIYILLFILLGGLVGEYVLQERIWRWAMLFGSLTVGMVAVNLSMYPNSRPVEWPGMRPRNAWVAAFLWARHHTPVDAVFALDPRYLILPGEDHHGFRAIAERSKLADALKDSGVVSLFPQLTSDWAAQQRAQAGWSHFQLANFERLARQYPVTWVVVQRPAPAGLTCLYTNQAVSVCRIPDAGKDK